MNTHATVEEPVSKQLIGKDTTVGVLLKTVFSLRSEQSGYKEELFLDEQRVRSHTRVEAGSNTSTVTLRVVRGDEKRSLKSETVKYGHEFQGTRTRERLRWQGPAAYTKDRSVLSSERAPHKNKTVTVKLINIWSWAPDEARHQDLLTDRQSQCNFDFVTTEQLLTFTKRPYTMESVGCCYIIIIIIIII
jgi:hypothetical protein